MNTHYQAVGRRKSAVATIFFKPQDGEKLVNHQHISQYFKGALFATSNSLKPLELLNQVGSFKSKIVGGGIIKQSDALRLALSLAIRKYLLDNDNHNQLTSEEVDEKITLLKENMLCTTDPRVTERKKYGLVKARKRQAFKKR